ncbi:MAG: GFA family protein [Pseudomonadota bacterium]
MSEASADGRVWRRGACHCGAVVFEAFVPPRITVDACNCSICAMTGFLHLIVPEAHFRLLSGADKLSVYKFNTGVAEHTFCSVCGVKPFYRLRSNPDGRSINYRCLDPNDFESVETRAFDGRNWEANAHTLSHLSKL